MTELLLTDIAYRTHRVVRILEMEMRKSWDTPADSLEVVFLSPYPRGQNLPELLQAAVYQDGALLFQGMVDEQCLSVEKGGETCTVQARSREAVLLDNQALPQLYLQPDLDTILQRHIRPYGFSMELEGNPRLSAFTVAKGMSEWEVLETFCRRALGHPPRIRPWQGGKLSPSPLTLAPLSFSEKIPGSSIEQRICRYAVLSEVVLKGASGYYDTKVTNPAAGGRGIIRRRYAAPVQPWLQRVEDTAEEMIRRSMERERELVITVPSLLSCQLGQRAVCPEGWGDGELLVAEIFYRAGPEGMTTRLSLRDRRWQ